MKSILFGVLVLAAGAASAQYHNPMSQQLINQGLQPRQNYGQIAPQPIYNPPPVYVAPPQPVYRPPVTYNQVGNTLYGSDGSTTNRVGNTIYFNPGNR